MQLNLLQNDSTPEAGNEQCVRMCITSNKTTLTETPKKQFCTDSQSVSNTVPLHRWSQHFISSTSLWSLHWKFQRAGMGSDDSKGQPFLLL